MATPSLANLALSGVLYPLYCVEGAFRAATYWGLGKSGPRLWASVGGLMATGAAALLLLRTISVPAGPVVALTAYIAGAAATIALRLIFATVFERNEDAT